MTVFPGHIAWSYCLFQQIYIMTLFTIQTSIIIQYGILYLRDMQGQTCSVSKANNTKQFLTPICHWEASNILWQIVPMTTSSLSPSPVSTLECLHPVDVCQGGMPLHSQPWCGSKAITLPWSCVGDRLSTCGGCRDDNGTAVYCGWRAPCVKPDVTRESKNEACFPLCILCACLRVWLRYSYETAWDGAHLRPQ